MHHSITVQNVVQRLRKLAASKFSMSPKAVTYICWSIWQAAGQNVAGTRILCHSWKMELWKINTIVGGFEVISIDTAMWNIGWMKEHCNCSQSLMYIYIHNIQTFDRAWQTFGEVRAPPVATLLFHLISSHHSLGTACGDTVFWCSGTAGGHPSHFMSPHDFDFCGHRLWRLSFLFFHTVSCLFGHHQWQLFYIHMSFEFKVLNKTVAVWGDSYQV